MRALFSGAQGAAEVFHLPARLLTAIFVCTFVLSGSWAQRNPGAHEGSRSAQVRALNNSVLQLHEQVLQQGSGSAGAIRRQAGEILTQRAAALEALMRENAHTALSFAFSPELLDELAARFPASAGVLEAHRSYSGPITVWTYDLVDGKGSTTRYEMNTTSGAVTLHFDGAAPDVAKGGVFQVTGVVLGSSMAVSESKKISPGAAGMAVHNESRTLPQSVEASAIFPVSLTSLLLILLAARFWRFLRARPLAYLREAAAFGLAVVFGMVNPATVSAQNSCSTTGAQNVAVILVTFPGTTLPSNVTNQSLNDIFFNTGTGPALDGFLRDASAGMTSATGSVFGPYTLTGTYTTCTDVSGAVLNDALAAAAAGGANLSSYSRFFLVFPDNFGCGWAGFGSNACSISSTSGNFNASVGYLSVAYVGTRAAGVSLASHELGHNFGLLHSGTINAGSEPLGPDSSLGTVTDMGDYWSSMGAVVLGTYPASQKSEVLGWMAPGTHYAVVENNGTFTLQPSETQPAGLQALKVQRGTGANAWLWIEYRQPTDNYDSTLSPQIFSGALIHYEDASTGSAHSYLPNFTPSDATGNSPALAAGQSWTDPYSNLTISVQSATSSGLTVSVSYAPAPCTPGTPGVTVSPINPSIYSGQTASYSVSVTNNDSPACAANTINLSSSQPSGWSTAFSSSSITLNPGQSIGLTMSKGAPQGAAVGTYAVNLNAATNSANSIGTANATVMAAPALAVSAAVAGTSFVPPGTVSMSATVTSGGIPASGATVAFKVTSPSGSTSSQNASTNANGVATYGFRLSQKSVAGTYSVIAVVAMTTGSRRNANTQSASSAPVTFVVQ